MLHTAFYCLEHIHYKYCVPRGVSGFFQSMITSNSSPCVTLRWVSTHLSSSSIGVISVIGALFVSKFITTVQNSSHKMYEENKKENKAMVADDIV